MHLGGQDSAGCNARTGQVMEQVTPTIAWSVRLGTAASLARRPRRPATQARLHQPESWNPGPQGAALKGGSGRTLTRISQLHTDGARGGSGGVAVFGGADSYDA